jgi:hypothetical protein
MIELNMEKEIKNRLEVDSNWKNVTCNATQLQLAVTSLDKDEILSSTHH